jgi:hypothetical protein
MVLEQTIPFLQVVGLRGTFQRKILNAEFENSFVHQNFKAPSALKGPLG